MFLRNLEKILIGPRYRMEDTNYGRKSNWISRDEEAFNNLIPLMESAGIACANPDEPAQRENGIHFFSAALNLALSPDPSEGHVGLKATKIIFISYCTTLYGGNRSD